MNYGSVKLFVCSSQNEVFSDTNINDVVIFATSNEQSIHIGALNAPNKIKISPFSTYITGELIAPQFALSNNKAFINNDGVMNAISFIGDGSKLESLNASMITSGSIYLPEGNATFNQVITSNLKICDATIDSSSLSGLTQLSGSNANFSNVIITSSLKVDNVTLDSSNISGLIKLTGSNASLSNALIESNLKIGNVILDTIGLSGFAEFIGSNASLSNITIMSNLEIGNVALDSDGLNGLINLKCSNASISNVTIESNLKIGNININETEINGFSKLVGSNGSLSNLTVSSLTVGNITLNASELEGFTQLSGSNVVLSNLSTSNLLAGNLIFNENGLSGFTQLTGSNVTLSNLVLNGDIDIRGALTSYGQPISLDGGTSESRKLTLSGATDNSLGTSTTPLSGGSISINLKMFTNAIIEFSKVNTETTLNFTPNLFTIDQVGQEGNIYLIERATTSRKVNLDSRMALVNYESNLSPPMYTTTPNTSNITIDVINYLILRPDYAVYTVSNIHKPPSLEPPYFSTTTATLTNVTIGDYIVNLPSYNNNGGGEVTYAITSNPKNNAKIIGSNVIISGYYRGGQGPYNVLATVNNFVGASIPLIITVTEVDGRPLFKKNDFITIQKNNYLFDLSSLYTNNIQNEPLIFTVIGNPKNNTTLTGNNLFIQGDYRNTIYEIIISCSNKYDVAATNSIIKVTEENGTPTAKSPSTSYTLQLDSKILSFESLFNNPSGEALTFTVTNNPYPSTSVVNPTLKQITIQGTLRGSSYTIAIKAENRFGIATTNIEITEISGAPTLVNNVNTYISNNVTNTLNQVQYTLNTMFNNLSGAALIYTVQEIPKYAYTISNGILTVTGNYRNENWEIKLTASATGYVGSSPVVTIHIKELSPAPTLISLTRSYTDLHKNLTNLDLTTIFANPLGTGPIVYSISYNGGGGASIINSTFQHVANYRNSTYEIHITATNNYTMFVSQPFKITITEVSPAPTFANESQKSWVGLKLEVQALNLSTLFTNKASTGGMTYKIYPSNYPDSFQLSGNFLTHIAFLRNATYSVSITATNDYLIESSAYILYITELTGVHYDMTFMTAQNYTNSAKQLSVETLGYTIQPSGGTEWYKKPQYLNLTPNEIMFRFVVPQTGTYTILLQGAGGGDCLDINYNQVHRGGYGALVQASYSLIVNQNVFFVLGSKGGDRYIDGHTGDGIVTLGGAGGGGATSVYIEQSSGVYNTPQFMIAGGGGGAARYAAGSDSIEGPGTSAHGGNTLNGKGGGGGGGGAYSVGRSRQTTSGTNAIGEYGLSGGGGRVVYFYTEDKSFGYGGYGGAKYSESFRNVSQGGYGGGGGGGFLLEADQTYHSGAGGGGGYEGGKGSIDDRVGGSAGTSVISGSLFGTHTINSADLLRVSNRSGHIRITRT